MYYLYNNKIYELDTDKLWVSVLDTTGLSFYREVIYGPSGVVPMGAHREAIKFDLYKKIKAEGKIWSKERVEKRLRRRENGMFYTFKPKFNFSLKRWIKRKLNI